MYELKPISRDAIPRAIQKAERYRLLNQSWAAESICLDILNIDPGNQQVLVMLVLALTDIHSGVAASGVKRANGRSATGFPAASSVTAAIVRCAESVVSIVPSDRKAGPLWTMIPWRMQVTRPCASSR